MTCWLSISFRGKWRTRRTGCSTCTSDACARLTRHGKRRVWHEQGIASQRVAAVGAN